MSLSPREERTLESIKERLTGSDPKLASRLAVFTRLVAGEDMPAWERIRAGGRRAARPSRRRPPDRGKAGRRTGLLYARPGFRRAALLLWLVISIVFVTVALALSRGDSHGGCTAAWAAVCTRAAPAHAPRSVHPGTTAGQVHPAGG